MLEEKNGIKGHVSFDGFFGGRMVAIVSISSDAQFLLGGKVVVGPRGHFLLKA